MRIVISLFYACPMLWGIINKGSLFIYRSNAYWNHCRKLAYHTQVGMCMVKYQTGEKPNVCYARMHVIENDVKQNLIRLHVGK